MRDGRNGILYSRFDFDIALIRKTQGQITGTNQGNCRNFQENLTALVHCCLFESNRSKFERNRSRIGVFSTDTRFRAHKQDKNRTGQRNPRQETRIRIQKSYQSTGLPKFHPNTMSIKKLDVSVVNRIAAGEIIIQPANALKELLENSIDAGATNIDVLVKDGGLKLLQITDNGSGIALEDLPLLCERFATSKLQTFGDLSTISTYGFRGEALASISHISRLSVVSKTPKAPLAYKAYYSNGQLASAKFKNENSKPKPVAGTDGTQISVEDLFYNVPSRLRAMRSKSDELAKILDVVGRYAVHSQGVGFSCKKFGELLPQISTRPQAPLKERIRTVFGTLVASELIEYDFGGLTEYGVMRLYGAVSGLSYNNKRKTAPVFFINGRLVSCDPLKRALSSVFLVFLPKGNHAFVYMSLELVPQNLDVNVHPTKREVGFLHEDEIIAWVSGKMHDLLSSRDVSRTFKQSTLKRATEALIDEVPVKKNRQENKLVRVDALQPKLNMDITLTFKTARNNESLNQPEPELFVSDDTQEVQLESIHRLRQCVKESIHRPLTNVFNNLVYIGIVDSAKRLCCIQYDVKLFLCDYAAVLAEFYYQVALANFSNYGEFVVEPTDLQNILALLYETHTDLIPQETVIERLLAMQDMFLEYFHLDLTGGKLRTLPMLLEDVAPPTNKLPFFIYRLGAKIDYDDEEKCLGQIMHQIALLYIPETIMAENETQEAQQIAARDTNTLDRSFEHTVFPAVRQQLIAPEKLLLEVIQVADLPGLYKVFERC